MKKVITKNRDKTNSGNISLYVTDKELFNKLLDEVSILWYQQFHESLSSSQTLTKAMFFLRQYLQNDQDKTETTPTIKKYARVGYENQG